MSSLRPGRSGSISLPEQAAEPAQENFLNRPLPTEIPGDVAELAKKAGVNIGLADVANPYLKEALGIQAAINANKIKIKSPKAPPTRGFRPDSLAGIQAIRAANPAQYSSGSASGGGVLLNPIEMDTAYAGDEGKSSGQFGQGFVGRFGEAYPGSSSLGARSVEGGPKQYYQDEDYKRLVDTAKKKDIENLYEFLNNPDIPEQEKQTEYQSTMARYQDPDPFFQMLHEQDLIKNYIPTPPSGGIEIEGSPQLPRSNDVQETFRRIKEAAGKFPGGSAAFFDQYLTKP